MNSPAYNKNPQPRFEREARGPGRQKLHVPKPKAWSHQDELKGLVGKRIFVEFAGGLNSEMIYILLNADQFTLQLANPLDPKKVFTVYKSALVGYAEA